MITSDLYQEIVGGLTSNKVRTGLTMLGIVIGIASVIAMLAIGVGAQNSIEESIQSVGSNLLTVRPGKSQGPGSQVRGSSGSANSLESSDVEALSGLELIKNIAPEESKNYQIVVNGNNTNSSVIGTTASYVEVKNMEIENGSFITEQHDLKMSKVAVLGPDVVEDLFPDIDAEEIIGKKIKINGIDFAIIGTTVAKGGSGFGSSDEMIFIPLSTSQQYLSGNENISNINIQVVDQDSMDSAQVQVEEILLSEHGIASIDDADFSVMNQADIIETASSITGVLTMLLGAVAGISLIVGGIGIMNMMLTTVTERTREIGLRKAIGAKKSDISKQFIVESIALTFIGGIIGVALGWGISYIITTTGVLQTEVTWYSVILAFSVSALIGVVFGYYPAHQAAKLNPIEALRYE
jgi:putative ABC transport system permease protein